MKNKGFTLIELLIVIAILAILCIIGFGGYMANKEANSKIEQKKEATAEQIQEEPPAVVNEAKKDWGKTL